MTEREKKHVVVPDYAVRPYLAKGYARSPKSAEEVLAHAWRLLPDTDRKDLVVLEIDAAQYEQLNQNPRRFGVSFVQDYYITSARARSYELLEEGEIESVVADAERDSGPDVVPNGNLFLTAQEAAMDSRETITSAIELHRTAIAALERFLKERL